VETESASYIGQSLLDFMEKAEINVRLISINEYEAENNRLLYMYTHSSKNSKEVIKKLKDTIVHLINYADGYRVKLRHFY
jgi:hypothetical protein